jgi:hypothetical protein
MESRKGTAESRWGWSGVEIVRESSSAKDQLRSAVDLLPYMVSSADQIVEQLLALGARYHRYLHQDEFGPKRAEQLAALRDVVQKLDLIIAQLTKSDDACETLSHCLATAALRPSSTQFDDAALEQLYEAAVDAIRRLSPVGDAAVHL